MIQKSYVIYQILQKFVVVVDFFFLAMPINAFSWPFLRSPFYFCSRRALNEDVDEICQCHYD